MTDGEDEDALLARLEKSLAATRRDAELVRSGGVTDLAAGMARMESLLNRLATAFDALLTGLSQQQQAIARIGAAVASGEEERLRLREVLETLAAEPEEHRTAPVAMAPQPPLWPAPTSVAARVTIVLVVLVLMLGSAAAGWLVASRPTALDTLAHRTALRLSALTGIDLAGQAGPRTLARPTAPGVPATPQSAQPPAPAMPMTPPSPALPAAALQPGAAPEGRPSAQPAAATATSPTPGTTSSAATVTSPTLGTTPAAPTETSPTAGTTPAAASVAAGAVSPNGTSPPSPGGASAMSPGSGSPPTESPQTASGATSVGAAPAVAAPVPPAARAVAAAPEAATNTAAALSQSAEPTTAATHPPAAAASPAPGSVAASPTPGQPSAAPHFVLRATANTWVWVRRQDGPTLLKRVLKAGETWPVPAEPDLLLDTGYAGGLVLEVDGVAERLTGGKGDVIRGVALGSDLLHTGMVQAIDGAGASSVTRHGAAAK